MQKILIAINEPLKKRVRRFNMLRLLGILLILGAFILIWDKPWAIFLELSGTIILIFHQTFKPNSLGR